MKRLLVGAKVYIDGTFERLDVAIDNHSIYKISPSISPSGFDHVLHLNDEYIVPGFVDVHVHLREPGFSYKETISSGTLAAARGGYTAVCSMPNLDPAPDSSAHIDVQLEKIASDAVIKVYPYGSITVGQMGKGELANFDETAGKVVAFSDDGRGVQSAELMESAMKKAASCNKIIAAHCEDDSLLNGGYIHDGVYAKAHGHNGISSASEWVQVERDLALAKKTGCRYHVCHVSTKESVALIRKAKAEGVKVTCETAPHYLILCDEELKDCGCYKMNPPIRAREDRDALIEGLIDGTIDVIATDHAPHSAQEKGKGLKGSVMGIVGLETAFSVLFTELVLKNIITLEKLIDLMSIAPRQIFGIGGGIWEGMVADLAVLDLTPQYNIDSETFLSLGRSTPFDGKAVQGENIMTIVDGQVVWQKDSKWGGGCNV